MSLDNRSLDQNNLNRKPSKSAKLKSTKFRFKQLDKLNNLANYFNQLCKQYGDKEAFVHLNSSIKYKKLDQLAQCLAGYWQSSGVKKADKVAVILPNCIQFPVAIVAAQKIGAVVVNINPELTERELISVLQDAEVRAVIVLDIFAKKMLSAYAKENKSTLIHNIIITRLPDLFGNIIKQSFYNFLLKFILKKVPSYKSEFGFARANSVRVIFFNKIIRQSHYYKNNFNQEDVVRNDLAFLQYTGGTTTGKPKAAMLSHGNILSNITQLTEQFGDYFELGKEVNIVALPMYHIFSLTVNLIFASGLGSKNILITDPRDFASFIKQIKPYKINMLVAVNTLFNKLLHHKLFNQLDFSKLKFCVAGGMALQEQVANDWKARTGHTVLEGYGLTEASPVVCMNDLSNRDYNGSIGKPLPNTLVKFLDENQNDLPQGAVGELAIKGPQVMQGYWKCPEETKKIFTLDGYLLTGDMGYQDKNGLVYLKERKKDVIIVSGFNVYPNEVESVLVTHKAIVEAAVIGVIQKSGSEKIIAYVVLEADSLNTVDEQALIKYCAELLTKYKIPREIIFTKELPKTNVGKVLRRKLREDYLNKNTKQH